MLVAGTAAGLEVHLPGGAGQTVELQTQTVERQLRVGCGEHFLEREDIHVHPGDGTGQPREVCGLVRARAVRRAAAGKPADIPGAHAQDRGIGRGHAAATRHDLLASLGRGRDQALGGQLRGRRASDRAPHVARQDGVCSGYV
jgi:hypothetical protein